MALNIRWGNRLETLADDLFVRLGEGKAAAPADVLAKRDAIVVSHRIQQAWLQQRFLYDMERTGGPVPHVLAQCDFPQLHLLVNDWLFRMAQPETGLARPDPEQHPFSVKSMRWRIYDFLHTHRLDGDFEPLDRYVAARIGASPDPRKCFKLAGRLAALMDQYTTCRPAMLTAWERMDDFTGTTGATRWQPALWRHLVQGQSDKTQLAAFRSMEAHLRDSPIAATYRRIFVFAPSMMPGVHLAFFRALGDILPVDFYLFNPSPATDWFDRDSARSRWADHPPLERAGDTDDLSSQDRMHPLLGAYARGARDLAAGTIDLTGGQIDDLFHRPAGTSVLAALQQSIVDCDASTAATPMDADGSIQLHLTHGNMREVEILRDQILRCFDDLDGLQPRHLQVQAADLDAYAPYIDAVFSTPAPQADSAIPYVIADRVAAGESQAAVAFRQLLNLADSRFAAPDLVDLLRCESLARKFGLEPGDIDTIAGWLNQAGIRWGQDSRHRQSLSGAAFEEWTTWRHGLDRLLLGYALGQDAAGPGAVIPCDVIEGADAVWLGRVARFYDRLAAFAQVAARPHPVSEWARELDRLVEDCFVSDNETFLDVALLKGAVRLLRTSIEAAGFTGEVPMAVIRDFLTGHLSETMGGTDLNRNAVVFSSLRPGSSTPRRVQCLLGMGDSLFPRTENRPAYDLLRNARRLGDRSPAIEDRAAFLEVLLNARERLLISYPAFSEEDNSPAGESVVVRELTDDLAARFGPHSYERIRHRLHAFHPACFGGDPDRYPGLFSYSRENHAAALALQRRQMPAGDSPDVTLRERPAPASPAVPAHLHLEIDDLARFFRNPARFYYNQVLGIRLELGGEAALADSEPFQPDALEQSQVRDRILRAALDNPAPAGWETLRAELAADGLLPLGRWGRTWFDESRENVGALLASRWEHLGILREALLAGQRTPVLDVSEILDVDGTVVTLAGRVPLFTPPAEQGPVLPTSLVFRCAAPRTDVLLGVWLNHLLLRAGGRDVFSIVAQGKDAEALSREDKVAAYGFGERSAEDGGEPSDAKDLLRVYLRFYLEGLRNIPPFTPETALAYVLQKRKMEAGAAAMPGESPAEAIAIQTRAIEAARGKWTSGFSQTAFSGDADPYFRAAFGADGPFQDPVAFGRLADHVMEPMLQSRVRLKPMENGP